MIRMLFATALALTPAVASAQSQACAALSSKDAQRIQNQVGVLNDMYNFYLQGVLASCMVSGNSLAKSPLGKVCKAFQPNANTQQFLAENQISRADALKVCQRNDSTVESRFIVEEMLKSRGYPFA